MRLLPVSLLLLVSFISAEASKPNILVIMVDDMGFSDPGCFGGEIQTPNLDSLAANGLQFTQFYNAARCSPSRASFMTGQYPHAVNMGSNGNSLGRNGITIAEALGGANGYNTAMVGKWHLSALPSTPGSCSSREEWLNHQCALNAIFAADINTYPANRGFDRHYGVIWGVVNFFDPFSLVDGTSNVTNAPADWAATHGGEDYYITDDFTEKTIQYINDFSQDTKPFFLYLQHTAPHWPLHARPEDIAKYDGVYDVGYAAIRNARYQRQINELGLFNPATAPLPASQNDNWNSLSANDKAIQAAKMATHAAMIDRVDQGIGDIIQALQTNGIFNNTLILFFSDNGCSPEVPSQPGYDRPSETRGGTPLKYSGFAPAGVGSEITFTGLGNGWANVSNTPMRYWKKESFEGGNCTAMIAHWPDGITVQGGSIIRDMGHVMDVMPTCLEIADVNYPATYNGYTLDPIEGQSLVPLFTGQDRPQYTELYFEHSGGKAARVGDWKLTQLSSSSDWQLYNIANDRTETQNVETQNPLIYQDLLNKWNVWACRMGISGAVCNDGTPPTPNPAQFDSPPSAASSTAIDMTSVVGQDPYSVEYQFEEVSDNPGGTTSSWQTSVNYTDSGLRPGTLYSYRVKMRDSGGNETTPSGTFDAWTLGEPDLDDSGKIDLGDMTKLSGGWDLSNCLGGDLCGGLDIDLSDAVDLGDLVMIVQAWLTIENTIPTVLFSDTYNRVNSYDIDASSVGMSGTFAPLVYEESFEGSGSDSSIQIVSNQLQMATGAGMSSMYLNHNFIDSIILEDGGFSVSLDVVTINSANGSDEANRFGGFGIGNTLSEVQAAGDSYDSAVPLRPNTARADQDLGVSDFYVDLALDQNLRLWSNGTLLNTINVGTAYGTIRAEFVLTDYNAGSSVTVDLYFNDVLQDTATFNWDGTEENYIGLSCRATTYVRLDNLGISTIIAD